MKAFWAAKKFNILTLGDDSGVFISGLDYFPGVHSRRWSGLSEDDLGRNKRILELMENNLEREAILASRFSLCNTTGEIFRTVVKNKFTLANKIHGDYGFGYDSLLIPSEVNIINARLVGRLTESRANEIIEKELTIGELKQEEKNAINDRGRIAKEIAKFLGGYLG